jgi:hypothetical protein
MPVAIDTSVLISAEKQGDIEQLLPENEEGPYYIPALAAAEFLVGTLRQCGQICDNGQIIFTRRAYGILCRASQKRMQHD